MLALEEASLVKVENVILGEKSESGRNLKGEHLLSSSNFLSLPNFRFSHSAGWRPPAGLESANEKKNGLLVPFGPTESWSKNFLT